jgi:hypothetical protein
MAEVDRHRPLGGIERGKRGEEGTHLRRLHRHHRLGRACRSGRIAGQGEDERPYPPGRAILRSKLPVDDRERLVAFAADRVRQGQATADFGILLAAERKIVVRLRPARLSAKIVGKAAVAGEFRLRNAEARRLGKELKGGRDLLHLHEGGAHAGLDAAVARGDLLGAGEEGKRGLRVAELERSLAGADQGGDVARLIRDRLQVTRQSGAGILLIKTGRHGLRPRSRAHRGPRHQQREAEPQAHHLPGIHGEQISPIWVLPTIAGASKRAKLVRWGGETAAGAGTSRR